MKTNSKHPLIKLISICGQIAEHQSEKMQQHNIDEAELLTALSEDQQKQLSELLTILQKRWISQHREAKKAYLENKDKNAN